MILQRSNKKRVSIRDNILYRCIKCHRITAFCHTNYELIFGKDFPYVERFNKREEKHIMKCCKTDSFSSNTINKRYEIVPLTSQL